MASNLCDHLGKRILPPPPGKDVRKSWHHCDRGYGIVCPCECGAKVCHSSREEKLQALVAERTEFIESIPAYPEGAFSGRGAVILGGGKYEASAWVTIHMLRHFGWKHPIEVWYRSHEETRPNRVAELPGVEIRDASQIERRGGWQSKMLAILSSRFEEVLFLDADCYPVAPFEEETFAACDRGFLIWRDMVSGDKNLNWAAHGMLPDLSTGILGGRYVIRKAQAWPILQLANWIDSHSDFYYPHQHGDQDSLRVAVSLLRIPVNRVPGRPTIRGRCYVETDAKGQGEAWVHRFDNKFGEGFSKPCGLEQSLPQENLAWRFYLEYLRVPGETPGWMSGEECEFLTESARGAKVLELGRFAGRSTKALAQSAESVVSVDQLPISLADPMPPNVTLIEGDFSQAPEVPFDVVMVDGHHDAPSVRRDLAIALARNPQTILVHDYGARSVWPEVAPVADAVLRRAGYTLERVVHTLARFRRTGITVLPTPRTDAEHRAAANEFAATIPPYPEGRFAGRGVVIAGGGKYWPSAFVAARMLRHVGCRLPIQIWHLKGEADPRYERLLKPFGVEIVDASQHPARATRRIVNGFEVKLFGVLHSPFEEVLFLDADNYPCADPTPLFDHPDYQRTGAIFWPDLPMTNKWTRWDFWGVEPHGPTCGWETGQYLVSKRNAWEPLLLAEWYDDHSDWCYGKGDHGDKGPHRVAWAKLKRSPTFFATKPIWKEFAFLQPGANGQTLFVHRCRSKFVVEETKFTTTPQRGINRTAGLPGEKAAIGYLNELSRAIFENVTGRAIGRG